MAKFSYYLFRKTSDARGNTVFFSLIHGSVIEAVSVRPLEKTSKTASVKEEETATFSQISALRPVEFRFVAELVDSQTLTLRCLKYVHWNSL